jgi:hypothetical protein
MVLNSAGRYRGDYTSLAVETLDQSRAPSGRHPLQEIRDQSSAANVTLLFAGDCADDAQSRAGQSSYAQGPSDDSR